MLELTEKLRQPQLSTGVLALPFEIRQKSRFRAVLKDGREVGVFIERGSVLRHGDYLGDGGGQVIAVEAAAESVSTVCARSSEQLARAAYHLGNRHVPLQVGDGWLRYLADHVLDGMCEHLGLVVSHENQPFEPEAGAYGHHHHE
ncbi:MAG: urease accessory protein UreE [bacterium]